MNSSRSVWLFSALLLVAYAGLLTLLWRLQLLKLGELVENLSISIGWVITVLVATSQLSVAREENDRLTKLQLRRGLQVEVTKRIAEASTAFTKILTTVGTPYRIVKALLSRPHPIGVPSLQRFIREQLPSHPQFLYSGVSEFVFTAEAYELPLLGLRHLRHFLQFRTDDIAQEILDLHGRITETPAEQYLVEPHRSELEKACASIDAKLINLMGYVNDFRVEVANHMLMDTFDSKIPRRQPLDPKLKVLTDLATPESVATEGQRRNLEAIAAQVAAERNNIGGPN